MQSTFHYDIISSEPEGMLVPLFMALPWCCDSADPILTSYSEVSDTLCDEDCQTRPRSDEHNQNGGLTVTSGSNN